MPQRGANEPLEERNREEKNEKAVAADVTLAELDLLYRSDKESLCYRERAKQGRQLSTALGVVLATAGEMRFSSISCISPTEARATSSVRFSDAG